MDVDVNVIPHPPIGTTPARETTIRETFIDGFGIALFDKKTDHVLLYDPTDNTLAKMTDFHEEMRNTSAFLATNLAGCIYVLMENRSVFKLKYSDDPPRWERIADMFYQHGWRPPIAVMNGYIYVIGGSGACVVNSGERYCSSSNQWERMKGKILQTWDNALVAAEGYVYSIGGETKDQVLREVERFDVSCSLWNIFFPMQEARRGPAAEESNGQIFVFGGCSAKGMLSTAEYFNPITKTWIMIKSMLRSRHLFQAFESAGHIYAVGGEARFEGASVERYDIGKGVWEDMQIPKNTIKIYASAKIFRLAVSQNRNVSLAELKLGMKLCAERRGTFEYDDEHLTREDKKALRKYGNSLLDQQVETSSKSKQLLRKENRTQHFVKTKRTYFAPGSRLLKRRHRTLDFSNAPQKLRRRTANEDSTSVTSVQELLTCEQKQLEQPAEVQNNEQSKQDVRLDTKEISKVQATVANKSTRRVKNFKPRTLSELVKFRSIQKAQETISTAEDGKFDLKTRRNYQKHRMKLGMSSNSRRFQTIATTKARLRSHPAMSNFVVTDSGYGTSSFMSTISDKASLRRYSTDPANDDERLSLIDSTKIISMGTISETESVEKDDPTGQNKSEYSPKSHSRGSVKHRHTPTAWDPLKVEKQRYEMTCLGLGMKEDCQQRVENWLKELEPEKADKMEEEYRNSTDHIQWIEKHRNDKAALLCIQNHGMSIVERNLTESDIDLISEVLSKCVHTSKLEIVCCGPAEKFRQLMQRISDCNCRITKFSIEEIENLADFSHEICSVVKNCSCCSLRFAVDNLTFSDMEKLKFTFKNFEIKDLEEFDISHNESLEKSGFEVLGEILKEVHGKFCQKLTIMDCGLTDDYLKSLQKSLDGAEFDDLSIACNQKLTSGGYEILGKVVTSSGVTSVGMSNCSITAEKLSSLLKAIPEKLKKLDASYNICLDKKEIEELARILEKTNVDSLNLAGCKLDEIRLRALKDSILSKENPAQLQELNMSDNFCIGGGLTEVAKIIEKTGLSNLNLSNCMLMTGHLREFAMSLGSLQLAKLDLSDRGRHADEKYVRVILELLPCVTETLTLQFEQFDDSYTKMLQESLNGLQSSNLTIIISSKKKLRKTQ